MEATDQKIDELTDLRAWIQKKVREYKEPARAGLPRGEELPVPKHKYHAALLMLSYESEAFPGLHQIAKESKLKYGLLGKWRMEDKFWHLAEQAAGEFLEDWLKFYLSVSKEIDETENAKEKARLMGTINHLLKLVENTWGDYLIYPAIEKVDTMAKEKNLPIACLDSLYRLLNAMIKPRLHGGLAILMEDYVEACANLGRAIKRTTNKIVEKGNKNKIKAAVATLVSMASLANDNTFLLVSRDSSEKR